MDDGMLDYLVAELAMGQSAVKRRPWSTVHDAEIHVTRSATRCMVLFT